MLNGTETRELQTLVDTALDGELTGPQLARLDALICDSPDARRYYAERVAMVAELERKTGLLSAAPAAGPRALFWNPSLTTLGNLSRMGQGVAVLLVVGACVSYLLSSGEPIIAKITGSGGPVLFTGDGGRVTSDLRVGTELTGGTLEGTTPDSWAELEFSDGSRVTISGDTRLTFSDFGQKVLYLKQGSAAADVNPQLPGKPMLVHTPTAFLEVLGTQFNLEAARESTTVNVSEGAVRVKRLIDGRAVEVPARHRVVAAADVALSPVQSSPSMSSWKSQLQLGPQGTFGKWSPQTETEGANLKAIPYVYTMPNGQTVTVHNVGFQISAGGNRPLHLQSDSRIRVRGRLAARTPVMFGVKVQYPAGGFAGNFFTTMPASAFESGQAFEVLLDVKDFQSDPSNSRNKDESVSDLAPMLVDAFWCNSFQVSAGLELFEVEFVSPTTPAAIP